MLLNVLAAYLSMKNRSSLALLACVGGNGRVDWMGGGGCRLRQPVTRVAFGGLASGRALQDSLLGKLCGSVHASRLRKSLLTEAVM